MEIWFLTHHHGVKIINKIGRILIQSSLSYSKFCKNKIYVLYDWRNIPRTESWNTTDLQELLFLKKLCDATVSESHSAITTKIV